MTRIGYYTHTLIAAKTEVVCVCVCERTRSVTVILAFALRHTKARAHVKVSLEWSIELNNLVILNPMKDSQTHWVGSDHWTCYSCSSTAMLM